MLLPALILLLFVGLPSAFACQLPDNRAESLNTRVDRCHLIITQEDRVPCCQSKACHQAIPQQRDLGTPEYQTRQKDSHPLVHESRPLVPQFKTGEIFHTVHMNPDDTQFKQTKAHMPFQALLCLRSVVLLH